MSLNEIGISEIKHTPPLLFRFSITLQLKTNNLKSKYQLLGIEIQELILIRFIKN